MKIDRRSRVSLTLSRAAALLARLSLVLLPAILSVQPAGTLVAKAATEPAAAGSSTQLAFSPAVTTLNVWYIRITTAVITHNQKDLAKYAAKMRAFAADKSKPFLWLPATRAEVLCLAHLDDQKKFVETFTALALAKGDAARQDRLAPFIGYISQSLAKHHRQSWFDESAENIAHHSHTGPTKEMVSLVAAAANSVEPLTARGMFVHAAIGRAKADIAAMKAKGEISPKLAAEFAANLKSLRLLALRLDAGALKIAATQSDVLGFITRYHSQDPLSAAAFNMMIAVMNQRIMQARTPLGKRLIAARGAWMANWQPKFAAAPGNSGAMVSRSWAIWEANVKNAASEK